VDVSAGSAFSVFGTLVAFVLLLFFIGLWGYCAYAVLKRAEKGVGWKVGWLALLVFFPPLGVIAFVIFGIARR
jgi:Phospholipase_D-nuclease N-terminal